MASQNTVSRDKLTNEDRRILGLCQNVIDIISPNIPSGNDRSQFIKEFGTLHGSRDAGQGRAAGKLQRDALTSRGRQAKAPYSNRNLRWHPLVVATNCYSPFHSIEEITILPNKLLQFKIDGRQYLPEEVYTLPQPYCISADKWSPISEDLKSWSQDDWTKNWCTIPAAEYCPPKDALESIAILGLIIAASYFRANLTTTFNSLAQLINDNFPDNNSFPACDENLLNCPLCKSPLSQYPAGLQTRTRPTIWNPPWQKSKRGEGDDESIQLTHIEPLTEGKISHTAKLTRYGHRWCNVAMTDHSIEGTLDFMESICRKHGRI
ncbi:MAG TPA: hypothetical protein PLT76_03045 [Candidatus Omnitrophota bacterium]|nr:hypothetical protein [Candidatus Omnitrophota bacterium]